MTRNKKNRLEPLLSLVLPTKKGQELWCDLGAGKGFFLELLHDRLPNAEIIQFDKTIVKRRGRMAVQGDINKLPFRASVFEGVLCSQVLHYFPPSTRRDIFYEIYTTLFYRGKLIIIEYDTSQSYPWIPYPLPREKIRRETLESTLFGEERLVRADLKYRPKYAIYFRKNE